MKNVLFIVLSILLFTGCEDERMVKQELQREIVVLTNQKENLDHMLDIDDRLHKEYQQEIREMKEKLRVMKIYEKGDTPQYILKIKLKQSHFSLSIKKHIKDSMNEIEFEMPVDKEFYDSVHVGTEILDEFRSGSFILYGSMGDWKMTVKSKEIR
tara:strand:- start:888 stop:1352 length:465 start_codon:yes stop_codon:yes gene_type:complete